MVFGVVNGTKKAFVRIGLFGIDLLVGYVEELTSNVTQATPVNAMDVIPTTKVPDSQILIKKSAYVTGVALTSSVVKNRIVDIISGATFTGLI